MPAPALTPRPLLLHEESGQGVQVRRSDGIAVATYLAPSPERSGASEDHALIAQVGHGMHVLCVADGCGGMPAGGSAASIAIESLWRTLAESDPRTMQDASGAIVAGFERANDDVLAMGIGAATTLCAAIVGEGGARIVHVGDSPALITGQRGRIRFEAIAHSPTGYAVESGMMTEAEAMTHQDRSVVLNVVGTQEMRVDVGPLIPLRRRDTILLASDGLTDNLLTTEIVEIIRAGDLGSSTQRLVDIARGRMTGEDETRPGHADDLVVIACRGAG